MRIKIDELDLSCQTRAGTDAEHICEIAEKMADGHEFPNPVVFRDPRGKLILADGFHRVMAAKQNGRNCINADIREGSRQDAILFGGTANNNQGKVPTRADVRHFLEMVWAEKEHYFGGIPTGRNLAAKCGVSSRTGDNFVKEKLGEMAESSPALPVKAPVKLIGRDGKTYPAPAQIAHVTPPVKAPAKTVNQAANVMRDRHGMYIPKNLEGVFLGSELKRISALISEAKCSVERGLEEKDEEFAKVNQRCVAYLSNAYQEIKAAMPFCVCPICKGRGCRSCSDAGFQSEDQYRRTPDEMK